MKLYTKQGDDGGTALFDGTRVRKDDLRVSAYGEVDELNAHIGAAACLAADRAGEAAKSGAAEVSGKWQSLVDRLAAVQRDLFTLGAELATPQEGRPGGRPKSPTTGEVDVARLEGWIDEATAATSPLRNFILPGGSAAAAQLHICRTVCRRAERGVVTLTAAAAINGQIVIYLNRLSDLLFAWARWANVLSGVDDVPWRP